MAEKSGPRALKTTGPVTRPQQPAHDNAVADAVQSVLHPGAQSLTPASTAGREMAVEAPSTEADAIATPAQPEPSAPVSGPATEPATSPPVADSKSDAPAIDGKPAEPARPRTAKPSPEPRPETGGTSSGKPDPQPVASEPTPAPDLDRLAASVGQWMEQSGKAASAYLAPGDEKPRAAPMSQDMSEAFKALGQVAEHWFLEPSRLMQAQTSFSSKFLELWASSVQRLAGPTQGQGAEAPQPDQKPADKRFADPEWRQNPVFDFVHKAYLLGTDWASKLVEGADSLDEPTRDKARFYLRQISSALSPSNFVPTNPELLRETIQQKGSNLVRGMAMLAEDLAAGDGALKIRQTDASKFELGVNMAMTPGKVVFRNELIELLQYAPTTETVLRRPLLIVPPWINKFYVLDLNPQKSFIRWAVAQGVTVFVVSWVNPDERHAAKGFEAYMRDGIFAALDAVTAATGETDIAAIGYCVGGTLLAVALAYMAAEGDRRISSATLFTTQVDFSHAGDLKVFADEAQISALEAEMKEIGYLKGSKMAQAFNMLRPDELIWSYVVNNYLKGKEPMPFDLLAWNSDSTRMPAANHSFYLRNCYLENKLSRGLMEVGGRRLDLGMVTIPIYNLATREDHIAPARSVFEGSRAFGGPVRYVLAGSGHIAGVVNPPDKAKYGFWDGPAPVGALTDWLAAAVHHPGSWWPDWFAWLEAQAPERVAAREPGGALETLGDAPGTYVRVRS